MRDYFAGQALGSVIAMMANGQHTVEQRGAASAATEAYKVADAMLAEREKLTEADNGN